MLHVALQHVRDLHCILWCGQSCHALSIAHQLILCTTCIQVDTTLERHFAAQEMAADRTLVKLFLEAVKVLEQGMCCAWGLESAVTGIEQLSSRGAWELSTC